MGNFGRVLRLALRYRWTFAASIVSALAVGVLWGANIGAVYPFVEVTFKGDSLHGWVDAKIDSARAGIDEWTAKARQLESEKAEASADRRRMLDNQIGLAEARVEAEQAALDRYRQMRPYIRRYLPDDAFLTLALILVVLLAGTILKSFFLVTNNVLIARLSQLGTFNLRKLFFRRTLAMDMATFTSEGTSDLLSRFTYDMECVQEGLDNLFGKLVREPLKMVACLLGAAFICWRLLLLSLVVAPLAAYLIGKLARILKRANRRAMEEMALLYSNLEESLGGIKVVKAFTMERRERRRFHLNSKTYYKKAMRIARYNALSHPLTEILGIVTICLALMAGVWLVLQGETHVLGIRMSARPLSLGTLLVFYGLLAGSADPMRKLSGVFTKIQRAAAASDRIYTHLDREPRVRDPKHPRPLARHSKDLVFDGVEFGYAPGRPVVRDIDLEIRFGETVAIVGPSGCGKSSLVNLIPRFADPTAGEIRLDGIPLDQVRLRDLRGQIGLVTQEPLLFDDTVANNIRHGFPGATDEQVLEAARQAHAHRFILEELPDGYDTEIGPQGAQLSGGQRQRISLARAILRDPAILLLDEATSQIDLESERAIQQALEHFSRGRTVVLVTHRLGALDLADRIVAMEDGRILDAGTHEQLLARCEFYRRLYQIQSSDLRQSA